MRNSEENSDPKSVLKPRIGFGLPQVSNRKPQIWADCSTYYWKRQKSTLQCILAWNFSSAYDLIGEKFADIGNRIPLFFFVAQIGSVIQLKISRCRDFALRQLNDSFNVLRFATIQCDFRQLNVLRFATRSMIPLRDNSKFSFGRFAIQVGRKCVINWNQFDYFSMKIIISCDFDAEALQNWYDFLFRKD